MSSQAVAPKRIEGGIEVLRLKFVPVKQISRPPSVVPEECDIEVTVMESAVVKRSNEEARVDVDTTLELASTSDTLTEQLVPAAVSGAVAAVVRHTITPVELVNKLQDATAVLPSMISTIIRDTSLLNPLPIRLSSVPPAALLAGVDPLMPLALTAVKDKMPLTVKLPS